MPFNIPIQAFLQDIFGRKLLQTQEKKQESYETGYQTISLIFKLAEEEKDYMQENMIYLT